MTEPLIYSVGTQVVVQKETQEAYWELQKFIVLALKANPNVLECLYSPIVEFATPLAEELLAMREAFLSKLVFQTYSGYVASQFKKMQTDIRNQGRVKWKHVMHLIRLLISGIEVLREGKVTVEVDQQRDQLLEIKRGEVLFAEADAWRKRLQVEFEQAFQQTTLTDRPDYERVNDGSEIDLVTHDAAKFFGLMLKRNGYVLEQLLSPLVVFTTPEHEELKAIATSCITRHHAHHYLGFAATQWKLFEKKSPPRVKPLLYTFRVLLTGIHLMKTGEVQANLCLLNESAKLSYLDELIHRKQTGTEKGVLDAADMEFYQGEYERLTKELERVYEESKLPEMPSSRGALSDLLVRLRLREARLASLDELAAQA